MDQSSWPKQAVYDQFLLFGDSITEMANDQSRGFGFAAALADYYGRRLNVVNRGFSGYNTAQALHILPSIIPHPDVNSLRFMTVFFGANDACLKGFVTKQHIPLEEYGKNLEAILTHPQVKQQSPRMILITPPPVDEHQFLAQAQAAGETEYGRTAVQTKAYADTCREVGKKLNIDILDFWSVVMAKAGWKEGDILPGSLEREQDPTLKAFLHDGLHLNPAAYKVLYDELMRIISARWPDQLREGFGMVIKPWTTAPPILDQ